MQSFHLDACAVDRVDLNLNCNVIVCDVEVHADRTDEQRVA